MAKISMALIVIGCAMFVVGAGYAAFYDLFAGLLSLAMRGDVKAWFGVSFLAGIAVLTLGLCALFTSKTSKDAA